jgi:hypothetical protein
MRNGAGFNLGSAQLRVVVNSVAPCVLRSVKSNPAASTVANAGGAVSVPLRLTTTHNHESAPSRKGIAGSLAGTWERCQAVCPSERRRHRRYVPEPGCLFTTKYALDTSAQRYRMALRTHTRSLGSGSRFATPMSCPPRRTSRPDSGSRSLVDAPVPGQAARDTSHENPDRTGSRDACTPAVERRSTESTRVGAPSVCGPEPDRAGRE